MLAGRLFYSVPCNWGVGGGRDKLVYPFEGTGDNLYAYVVGNSWSLHLLEKQSLLFFQAPSALEHHKVLT